ncbi:DNA glycosylase AlkZ-like family protein [Streptomyces sp. NPDC002851]
MNVNPDHVSALYDRNGNIGPTIWADGRIVGAWAQRPDGHISRRLLTDPVTESRTAIDTTAHALSTWLGPTRITPSYRTPLERELAAPH